tara:strand:- start:1009 stop:1182 length:174 start_codon:yes stop_codon:yes gene_type:complete
MWEGKKEKDKEHSIFLQKIPKIYVITCQNGELSCKLNIIEKSPSQPATQNHPAKRDL